MNGIELPNRGTTQKTQIDIEKCKGKYRQRDDEGRRGIGIPNPLGNGMADRRISAICSLIAVVVGQRWYDGFHTCTVRQQRNFPTRRGGNSFCAVPHSGTAYKPIHRAILPGAQ